MEWGSTTWKIKVKLRRLEWRAFGKYSSELLTKFLRYKACHIYCMRCNISNLTMRTGLDLKVAQFDQVRSEAELERYARAKTSFESRPKTYLYLRTSTLLLYYTRIREVPVLEKCSLRRGLTVVCPKWFVKLLYTNLYSTIKVNL
jgi:hypothetical protein